MIKQQFETILLTESVYEECCHHSHLPGAILIQSAIHDEILPVVSDPQESFTLPSLLGAGEASSIHLALAHHCPLLIDDYLGRKFAQQHHISIIGILGILLLTKRRKLIKNIAPLIQYIQGIGYFLSQDLIKTILQHAGEWPGTKQ